MIQDSPASGLPIATRPFRALAWLRRHRLFILQAALIVAAGYFVFSPSFHGDWLWDDFEIRNNPTLHSGPGLGRIWFAPATADYYPLEATALWVQWHLWHENLLGYHLTTVGLHLLSAFLIWRLLKTLGARHAWLGGMLFAVHPLVVESVAWAAELKNTLSLPPLLMALDSYIRYDRAGEGASAQAVHRRHFLVQSLLWFLAAMLCKTSVVMFPAVLLLYAWWRRGRIGWADLRATAAFFCVSLILGVVAIHFQITRAIHGWRLPPGGARSRIADAGLSIEFYLSKFACPRELMPIYPRWAVGPPSPVQFLPWLVLAAVLAWLWIKRSGWGRHAIFGLGWFLINIAPVLGFVPMAYQHIAPVADHLAYVPLIGLIGLAVAGLDKWRGGPESAPRWWRSAWVCCTCTAAAIAVLALASRRYAGVFVNQETEWTYNLRHNSRSPMVYLNLAFAQNEDGRVEDAIVSFERAIQLDPDDSQTQNAAGNFLVDSNQLQKAIPHFEKALQLAPDFIETRRSVALALFKVGRTPEAIARFNEYLRERPDDAEIETDLGKALGEEGQPAAAKSHYEKALRIDARYAEAENSLGFALASEGRTQDGIAHLEHALAINPVFAEAHNNLGFVLTGLGRQKEAIFQFEQALRLKPDFGKAHNNLGFALASTGRRKEAIAQFEEALKLEPADPKAQFNLAVLLEMDNRIQEALAHLKEAVRLKPDFDDARSRLYRLEAVDILGESTPGADAPAQVKRSGN